MKLYNILPSALLSGVMTLGLLSCSSDIEPVYLLPGSDITIGGASADIILTPDNPQALAMTLYWSGDGHLSLSDTLIQAPVNAAVETIQFSRDENFSSTIDISVDKGMRSRQFLCAELNSLLGRLDFQADMLSPLYVRVRSALAANMEPEYTPTLKVMVQPYRIRLIIGTVIDRDWNDTGMQLASPDEDGIYRGFMGVNGWTNWWLREADNVVWGNVGADGMTFHASSADDHWNFWFPDPAGCYYTTLNTVEGWWSALHIDNLSVAGDLSGDMVFNIKTNQWTLPVNLPAPRDVTLTISGSGSLYDRETTDMGPAKPQTVGFGGDCSALTFGPTASPLTISLPAGETSLILDLSNPLGFRLEAGEAAGSTETEPRLYLSGVTDWDGFNLFLSLYDEATLAYGGAHWIDSEWGYRAYTQPDWAAAYKAADGSSPLAGSLVKADTDGNIPAPEKGLYVMDFKMKDLSYTLTKVKSVTYTGLNDDWTEYDMTPSPDNPEVFTAEFVKRQDTPWGVKVLVNHDWTLFFGGADGSLMLGHSDATPGFDGDNALTIGETYILRVDLGTQTYSYSLK